MQANVNYNVGFDDRSNSYPNPTGHIKWILAFLVYLITILQCYRDLLQYLLILLHYREVLHYREFITLLEQNIINDIL